MWKILLFTNKE